MWIWGGVDMSDFLPYVSKNHGLIFATFGAGRKGWKDASKRISEEARKSKLFANVYSLDANWLKTNDQESFDLILEVMKRNGPRGFGYWIWKPAILAWLVKQHPNSPILYIDAGSHIDTEPLLIRNFQTLIGSHNIARELAWALPGHSDIEWTKKELLSRLAPTNEQMESDQIQSGFILLPPTERAKIFVNEFRNLAFERNGFYFTDELEEDQNAIFRESRHDQSVLSLLWKKYGFYALPDQTDPSNFGNSAVIAMRNNTGLPSDRSKIRLQRRRYFDLIIDKCTIILKFFFQKI